MRALCAAPYAGVEDRMLCLLVVLGVVCCVLIYMLEIVKGVGYVLEPLEMMRYVI